MTITFPSNTKDIIDEIRSVIGREITIYVTVSGVACTQCDLDPTTGLATNPFCSECGGNYWTTTTSGVDVNAHVRWTNSEQPLYTEGGIIQEGDCKITITYSEDNLEYVRNSHHFLVDGKEMYMKNYAPKGAPSINRIAVTLLEDKG